MKDLVILRGVPGCGKSTVAELIGMGVNYRHYEADMYFYNEDGNYYFDARMLGEAHAWCQNMVKEAMESEIERVIVSNTSTKEEEMAPYFNLANENGYKIYSLIVENRHGGENVHNVPEEVLEKMKNRFEIKL